ncbi:hypothetical protein HDE_08425 [Halotydeus destructor]|nr:hypothetical protein HDE_08425 [Halotydeus destructor]
MSDSKHWAPRVAPPDLVPDLRQVAGKWTSPVNPVSCESEWKSKANPRDDLKLPNAPKINCNEEYLNGFRDFIHSWFTEEDYMIP